jgi:hypothetical protein
MAVSCLAWEPPDQIALLEKKKCRGPEPAAEATI